MINLVLPEREHGGDLDRAVARFGGTRAEWLDLSTGINPNPYPVGNISPGAWTALPDRDAFARIESAARPFWGVPEGAEVVVAPGASALIAAMPALHDGGPVHVSAPTYNEHAAAFRAAGHEVVESVEPAKHHALRIVVHPNNPDGRLHDDPAGADLVIIDESFADVGVPSHVGRVPGGEAVVLKSFGKFWGLAGLRLGFAICAPNHAAVLRRHLGPWAASGPALEIGARALADMDWAARTRAELAEMAGRLDAVVLASGAALVGGTSLFRLYRVADGRAMQDRLARAHVWSRVFADQPGWIRLGLPGDAVALDRVARALG